MKHKVVAAVVDKTVVMLEHQVAVNKVVAELVVDYYYCTGPLDIPLVGIVMH